MLIRRVWAMPNKETFKIKPLRELIHKYAGTGKNWIDPFVGDNSPAQYTNDLNLNSKALNHEDGYAFCESFDAMFAGIIFDPPYSLRQIKECYNGIGANLTYIETISFYSRIKNLMKDKINIGGFAVCCGWNTNGFGKNRGFKLIEVLIIAHGRDHNDTLVTVEQKIN